MLSSTGVLVTLRSDLTVGIGVRHRPPSRGRHRSLALINFCCPSFRGGFSGDFSSTFWRELCGPSCPASLLRVEQGRGGVSGAWSCRYYGVGTRGFQAAVKMAKFQTDPLPVSATRTE